MSEIPPCPQCKSTYAYLDRDVFNCPECGHEWSESAQEDNQRLFEHDQSWHKS